MEDRLQYIMKRLKSICTEEGIYATNDSILDNSVKIMISENIDKSKKENIKSMSNYQNTKKDEIQTPKTTNKVILATDKQKKLMSTLKIPFTDKTNIKEAKELIELKLGKGNVVIPEKYKEY